MSSRLFQEVRERRGLVYSIYSYQASFRDSGLFAIYAGTGPEHYREVLRLIEEELLRMAEVPLSPEELRRGKDQLKGNLLLGLESTNARMIRLAKMEIYFGQFFNLEEIIQGIEDITVEKVKDLAGRLFGPTNMPSPPSAPSAERSLFLSHSLIIFGSWSQVQSTMP